jgi:hypothetical protein
MDEIVEGDVEDVNRQVLAKLGLKPGDSPVDSDPADADFWFKSPKNVKTVESRQEK